MARKKKTSISRNVLMLTFYIVLIGAFMYGLSGTYSLFSGTQRLSLDYSEPVYEPVFASIRCAETDRETPDLYVYPYGEAEDMTIDYVSNDIVTTSDDSNYIEGFDLYCSRVNDRVFTDRCTIEAQYDLNKFAVISADVYICDVTEDDLNKCELVIDASIGEDQWVKIEDITREQVLKVRNLKETTFGFAREVEKGEIVFRSIRDEYGLFVDALGRIEVTNSCDLSHIIDTNSDILNYEYDIAENSNKIIGSRLVFGQTINYVYGFTPILESSRIIEDGEYYTYTAGFKYPVVEGESGRKYVDIRYDSKVEDSSIICDPAQLYCINDGTAIDSQFGIDKQCVDGVDLIDGWLAYTEKAGWVAQRTCVAGQWIEVNAKEIPTCGGNTPVLNEDFICVAGSTDVSPDTGDKDDDDGDDYFPLLVLGGVSVVAVLMRVKSNMEAKKGGMK